MRPAHEHVLVLALAADLLGVGARRLIAVVPICDQQLAPRLAVPVTAAIAAGSLDTARHGAPCPRGP